MLLEHLDKFNWRELHMIVCMAGVAMSLYAMQLYSLKIIGRDRPVIGQIRRGALTLLALALCGSLLYGNYRGWEPWPTDVLTVLAVDVFLLTTIISAHTRNPRNERQSQKKMLTS